MRLVATDQGHQDFLRIINGLINWPSHAGDLVERKAGDYIRQRFTRNFEEEGHPDKWAALAPMTVEQRRRLGFGGEHPILQRTRELKRSVVERGHQYNLSLLTQGRKKITLVLGSKDPRFGYLHGGTKRIPARPMVVLGNDDIPGLDEAIMFVIEQAMGRK